MRSLKYPNILLSVLVWAIGFPSAQAVVQQELSSTYSLTSASGNAGQTTLLGVGSDRVTRNDENFAYRFDGILDQLSISGGITLTQPNYSNYLIRDTQGNTHTLSEAISPATELSGTQTLEWNRGMHHASITWAGSLNQSPFSYQSGTALYQIGFFQKSTLFGVRATYLRQDQPQDYFINRDFQNQARPRVINAGEFVGSYEQILTERWKMFVDLSTAKRLEERPRNVGVTLGQGYAITSRVTAQLKGARFIELRSDPLLNERGYFTLTSGEFSITVEPLYDLLVTTSYSLSVEREFDPTTGAETQVAADQYGIGLRYPIHNYEIRVQGALGATNTSYQSVNFSGGVAWKI